MDIFFATPAVQRQCNERSALVARWGARRAAGLCRSLQEIAALDHLADVAALPHVRLTGQPSGRMMIGSSDGSQITVEAIDSGESPLSDLSQIGAVVVVGIAVGSEPANVRRSDG